MPEKGDTLSFIGRKEEERDGAGNVICLPERGVKYKVRRLYIYIYVYMYIYIYVYIYMYI